MSLQAIAEQQAVLAKQMAEAELPIITEALKLLNSTHGDRIIDGLKTAMPKVPEGFDSRTQMSNVVTVMEAVRQILGNRETALKAALAPATPENQAGDAG